MTFASWLSIAGLTLDLAGAGCLAYDVLFGPKARLQASLRRIQLALMQENRARTERRMQELSAQLAVEVSAQSIATDENQRQLQRELVALTQVVDETSAELAYWEKHEHRAQIKALVGLLLLMAGFITQAMGTLLPGRVGFPQ